MVPWAQLKTRFPAPFVRSPLHEPHPRSLWPLDLASLPDDGLFDKHPLNLSPPDADPHPPAFSPAARILCTTPGSRPASREGATKPRSSRRTPSAEQEHPALCPLRTTAMVALNVLRGLFPAFKGYSQALIVNELQALLSSDQFTWSRLLRLLVGEVARMALESLVDTFATNNENIVNGSARFVVEYHQMRQRTRLDAPALADPMVRDLLQESELFVRSFTGMGGFGLLSPLDFVRILTLVSELIAHVFILLALTRSPTHLGILLLSLASAILPHFNIAAWVGLARGQSDGMYTPAEARAMEKQEKMRGLVHCDSYRPEIQVFGLGPWILETWASARRTMLGLEQDQALVRSDLLSSLYAQFNLSEAFALFQHVPLLLFLQNSTSSLGSVALYRTSVQALIYTSRNLAHTTQMAYQGIFFMGAFCAAMEVEPRLQPPKTQQVGYKSVFGGGMRIEARNVSYTYPGCKEPALRGITFTLEAGETLAIVGYNGSGKSTLANILLRVIDFDAGELLVNGVDVRRFDPAEYHTHLTTVLQNFSKFNASVKENVGVGYIQDLGSPTAVERAVHLAGADKVVAGLPCGVQTKLDSLAPGFDAVPYPIAPGSPRLEEQHVHWHGLSGGEWQRVAISRAFMRAHRPEVDLLLFDEPTSALDAHAQNSVFDTIDKISRAPSGEKTKTVIFITHRLSTARRADKIAMLENGTVSEFGSHAELLARDGPYAALYRASI